MVTTWIRPSKNNKELKMKKLFLAIVIVPLIYVASCSNGDVKVGSSVPTLIKEGFLNDNEYEIVCIGFPKEGLSGIQKEESAKRAALLNAYYYAGVRFDSTVAPDKDGSVKKMEISDDYATVYYIIKKENLKSRLKK